MLQLSTSCCEVGTSWVWLWVHHYWKYGSKVDHHKAAHEGNRFIDYTRLLVVPLLWYGAFYTGKPAAPRVTGHICIPARSNLYIIFHFQPFLFLSTSATCCQPVKSNPCKHVKTVNIKAVWLTVSEDNPVSCRSPTFMDFCFYLPDS